MSEARLQFVDCLNTNPLDPGLHRMAYWVWDDRPESNPNPRVLLCVHGLSRQGKDFNFIGRALSKYFRVVAPDVVGRGKSDWLKQPSGYGIAQYASDMVTLIARLNAGELNWIGTSMGGIIGMALLGMDVERHFNVRRFVINDVGPAINSAAIARIGEYLGNAPRFFDMQAAVDYMWSVSKSFGPHTPEQWMNLCIPMVKGEKHDGRITYVMHYDPAIGVPFRAATEKDAVAGEAMLWACYDRITTRTLLLRGVESDLLSLKTAKAMTERGPKAELREFAGVGHAPMLVQADQVKAVGEFLLS